MLSASFLHVIATWALSSLMTGSHALMQQLQAGGTITQMLEVAIHLTGCKALISHIKEGQVSLGLT